MHRFTKPTPAGTAGHTVVEVFVSGWEIECCAPAPTVGESTTWRLEFVPAGGSHPELDHDRSWQVSRRADGATLLADGPVVAHWAGHAGPPPATGRATLRGYLYGNAHGPAPDDPVHTTGRVRRVRVVTGVYTRTPGRMLEPVPGTLQLSDVQRSPRRFAYGDGAEVRMETGVLIEMAVRNGPSAAGPGDPERGP